METGLLVYALVGIFIHLLIIALGVSIIKKIKRKETEILDIIHHSTCERDVVN
jgi:hypothetical protein